MALRDKYIKSNEDAYLVVTPATAFPTTVAPIVQAGLTPYFIDTNPATLNSYMPHIFESLRNPNVLGFSAAHTLGFPYDAKLIREKCDEYGKFFLEDACDALGSMTGRYKAGYYGHISTFSFFPAHNITTGEGGAVLTDDYELFSSVNNYRDWGRDCYCSPGQNNTCGKRFNQEFSGLPEGWDHKYTFTKLGYNLKMTEMQAALGWSQMDRLEEFTSIRTKNFYRLASALESNQDISRHLFYRTRLSGEDFDYCASPFGFPITVISKEFTRKELTDFLEMWGVKTRPVFAGNITRQPMSGHFYFETHDSLGGSDYIMNRTFWVGCWHGLDHFDMDYIYETICDFLHEKGLL
jgi:CDP-6-deoxy-D-xylo-4-hexulose-3-dehydrase